MSSFFNKKLLFAMLTGIYICPRCKNKLVWEDDMEETLVCVKCGYNVSGDEYGLDQMNND